MWTEKIEKYKKDLNHYKQELDNALEESNYERVSAMAIQISEVSHMLDYYNMNKL